MQLSPDEIEHMSQERFCSMASTGFDGTTAGPIMRLSFRTRYWLLICIPRDVRAVLRNCRDSMCGPAVVPAQGHETAGGCQCELDDHERGSVAQNQGRQGFLPPLTGVYRLFLTLGR